MTQVQQDSELFFTQLQDAQGTDQGSYDATKAFYLKTEATLHTLLTRAQSVPKSERVADQIGTIEKTVERIQGMHQRDKVLLLQISQATGPRWKASSVPFSHLNSL